jgi:hypoxanthine-DNA glycosylase
MDAMIHGFRPVAAPDARVLILGTIPGRESLVQNQYYANSHNAFWFIAGRLLEIPPGLAYEARLARLANAKVALWDVLASAKREGGLDSSIVRGSEKPNDFATFYRRHPAIRAVYFNGGASETLYRRLVLSSLPEDRSSLRLTRLPSTSPANTHFTKDGKLEAWRVIARELKGA